MAAKLHHNYLCGDRHDVSLSPVNKAYPIAVEWVFGVLKYSGLQGFAVFGGFPCDLCARLREGGSAWAAVLIQCAGLFHGADDAPQATCP
jgi:hypothetical protein